MKSEIDTLLKEMIMSQKSLLFKLGKERYKGLTEDDLLQTIDFPLLEEDPLFRYEEGILSGMMSVQTALRALFSQVKAEEII